MGQGQGKSAQTTAASGRVAFLRRSFAGDGADLRPALGAAVGRGAGDGGRGAGGEGWVGGIWRAGGGGVRAT